MKLLGEEQMDKLAEKYPLLDFSFEDDYREEVKIIKQAQAGLTGEEIIEEIKGLSWLSSVKIPQVRIMFEEDWQALKKGEKKWELGPRDRGLDSHIRGQ